MKLMKDYETEGKAPGHPGYPRQRYQSEAGDESEAALGKIARSLFCDPVEAAPGKTCLFDGHTCPVPEISTMFLVCVHFSWSLMRCPEGTLYTIDKAMCTNLHATSVTEHGQSNHKMPHQTRQENNVNTTYRYKPHARNGGRLLSRHARMFHKLEHGDRILALQEVRFAPKPEDGKYGATPTYRHED